MSRCNISKTQTHKPQCFEHKALFPIKSNVQPRPVSRAVVWCSLPVQNVPNLCLWRPNIKEPVKVGHSMRCISHLHCTNKRPRTYYTTCCTHCGSSSLTHSPHTHTHRGSCKGKGILLNLLHSMSPQIHLYIHKNTSCSLFFCHVLPKLFAQCEE